MGGVDRMDQNISAYMINIRNKKWWWPFIRFLIDLAVNNAHQLYRLQPLQPGQRALDLLGASKGDCLSLLFKVSECRESFT